jgi:hypothetical protein
VIGPSQRPLPDNTQHSQGTDNYAHSGIRTPKPSTRPATGIDYLFLQLLYLEDLRYVVSPVYERNDCQCSMVQQHTGDLS